jgi:hypothetical protein
MMKNGLTKNTNGYELTVSGSRMIMGSASGSLLEISFGENSEYNLQIENALEFIAPNGEATDLKLTDPHLGTALHDKFQDAMLDAVVITNEGDLFVSFKDGSKLNVYASDAYEAWNLNGPDELRLVSTPGRSLSVWHGISR